MEPKSWIWRHRDVKFAYLEGEDSGHYWPINNEEELAGVCYDYLKRPWLHCGLIDRMLVDAMIYKKVLAFGENVKPTFLHDDAAAIERVSLENLLKTKQKSLIDTTLNLFKGLVMIALIVSVGLGAAQAQGWWAGVLAAIGLWVLLEVNFFIKNLEKNKEIKRTLNLLVDMQNISSWMGKYPLSLFIIREQLIKISDKGAVWPMGIFPILDNAIARSQ